MKLLKFYRQSYCKARFSLYDRTENRVAGSCKKHHINKQNNSDKYTG